MLIESEKCKNILKFNLFEKWFKLNVYIVLMENIIILYFNWWVFFYKLFSKIVSNFIK